MVVGVTVVVDVLPLVVPVGGRMAVVLPVRVRSAPTRRSPVTCVAVVPRSDGVFVAVVPPIDVTDVVVAVTPVARAAVVCAVARRTMRCVAVLETRSVRGGGAPPRDGASVSW
jgi:hypothetical protein